RPDIEVQAAGSGGPDRSERPPGLDGPDRHPWPDPAQANVLDSLSFVPACPDIQNGDEVGRRLERSRASDSIPTAKVGGLAADDDRHERRPGLAVHHVKVRRPGRDREIDTGSVLQVTTGSPTGPAEGRPGKGSHRRPDGNLLAFASQAGEQDTARESETGPLYGSHRRCS